MCIRLRLMNIEEKIGLPNGRYAKMHQRCVWTLFIVNIVFYTLDNAQIIMESDNHVRIPQIDGNSRMITLLHLRARACVCVCLYVCWCC